MKSSTSPNLLRRPRPGEAGSAYIVVLLVLVVLTILGLSLALVTQTERQIGTSEKTIQRVFASAESGIALAVAKAMVLDEYSPLNLTYAEPRTRLDGTADPTLGNNPFLLRHNIAVSVLMPMLDSPCHLCQINTGGNTDIPYKNINHLVLSTATRSTLGGDVIGAQSVSSMVQIQPIEGANAPAYDADIGSAREKEPPPEEEEE